MQVNRVPICPVCAEIRAIAYRQDGSVARCYHCGYAPLYRDDKILLGIIALLVCIMAVIAIIDPVVLKTAFKG